jgi:hypothetical protein
MVWFVKRLAILMVISLLGVGGVNYFAPPSACLHLTYWDANYKMRIDAYTGNIFPLNPPSASKASGGAMLVSRSPDGRYGIYQHDDRIMGVDDSYLVRLDPALNDVQVSRQAWLDRAPLAYGFAWEGFNWAADSKRVLVLGAAGLLMIGIDGQQTLLFNKSNYTVGSWSGDGQFVAVHPRANIEHIDLWEVSSRKQVASVANSEYKTVQSLAWSPVGASLALVRSSKHDQAELLLLNVHSSGFTAQMPIPLLTAPFPDKSTNPWPPHAQMKWSSNGQYLAVLYLNIKNSWQIDLYELGEAQQFEKINEIDAGPSWKGVYIFAWSKDSRQLLFMRTQPSDNLQAWDFLVETGQERLVAEYVNDGTLDLNYLSPFDQSTHQRLLLSSHNVDGSNLMTYDLAQTPGNNSQAFASAEYISHWGRSEDRQHLGISFNWLKGDEYVQYVAIITDASPQVSVATASSERWVWAGDNLFYLVEFPTDERVLYYANFMNAITGKASHLAGPLDITRLYEDLNWGNVMMQWVDERGQNFLDGYSETGQLLYRFSGSRNQVGASVTMLRDFYGWYSEDDTDVTFTHVRIGKANITLPSYAVHVAPPLLSEDGYIAMLYSDTYYANPPSTNTLSLYNQQGQLLHSKILPGEDTHSISYWSNCAPNP